MPTIDFKTQFMDNVQIDAQDIAANSFEDFIKNLREQYASALQQIVDRKHTGVMIAGVSLQAEPDGDGAGAWAWVQVDYVRYKTEQELAREQQYVEQGRQARYRQYVALRNEFNPDGESKD